MADDGGIGRLEARLKRLPKAIVDAATPALLKQAQELAATMKQLAPVDTGDLRDSIVVTPPDATTPPYSQPGGFMVVPELSAAVTAGNTNVRYAHLVEYGTKASAGRASRRDTRFKSIVAMTRAYGSHAATPAQPFFWPAVRLHNKRAKKAIKAAIGRAVKKEWGK